MFTLRFDYSKRHCWPTTTGEYILDGSIEGEECPNPYEHIRKAGISEFMRWIREFGTLTPGIVTKFDDGWLKLGQDTMSTGESCYCENYGGKVKAFLNPNEGCAIVEIHDPELESFAKEAHLLVDDSYELQV